MAEKAVTPANGKFLISGRDQRGPRNVELDLGANDPGKFIVVTKDLPADIPAHKSGDPDFKYDWFACFGIRRKKADGSPGDFANITYNITLDPLPKGKKLFAYYGGQVRSLAYKTAGGKIKATLKVGDPPIGMGP
jgi:hypothetical protein